MVIAAINMKWESDLRIQWKELGGLIENDATQRAHASFPCFRDHRIEKRRPFRIVDAVQSERPFPFLTPSDPPAGAKGKKRIYEVVYLYMIDPTGVKKQTLVNGLLHSNGTPMNGNCG
jgi:hypothetical protein